MNNALPEATLWAIACVLPAVCAGEVTGACCASLIVSIHKNHSDVSVFYVGGLERLGQLWSSSKDYFGSNILRQNSCKAHEVKC